MMGGVLNRTDSSGLNRLHIGSFPCYASESSFRQLDDVFLQTQTRIWLGEVVETRLDEETCTADLLADGLLLFKVSKVIWKMLLTKFMKLRSAKAYFSRSVSGKNSGRYMPYSNVDSFLKICQILGLTSIDLFSPSDVVEKRDVRRVCMCIRSLSKKARAKGVNVPDFDVVKYTIAMSTDMVKGIRNSLEQSQCKLSELSAGCCSELVSTPKYGQRNWRSDFAKQYDLYSEDSDNTDSDYQVGGFYSPASTTSCDGAPYLDSDVENSPRGSFMVVENFHLTQYMLQTDGQDEELDRHNIGSYNSSPVARGSFNAYNLLNSNHCFNDSLADARVSPSVYSMEPTAGTACGNKEAIRKALNTPQDDMVRVSSANLALESCAVFMGNSVDHYEAGRNVIGQSGVAYINGCSMDGNESALCNGHGKDSVFNLQRETRLNEPDCAYKTTVYQHGNDSLQEIKNVDVFSTALPDLGEADMTGYKEEKKVFSNANIRLPKHQKRIECQIQVDKSTLSTDKLLFNSNSEEVNFTKPLPAEEYSRMIISDECKGSETSNFLTPFNKYASYISQPLINISRDNEGIQYTYHVLNGLEVPGPCLTRSMEEDVIQNLRSSLLLESCSSTSIESTREALNATESMPTSKKEKYSDCDAYTVSMVSADDYVAQHSGGIVLDTCVQALENHPCKMPNSKSDKREQFPDVNELKSAHQTSTVHQDVASSTEYLDKEKIEHKEATRDVEASERRRRKMLLKSFAGGMSVLGMLILFFQLRKRNGAEEISETNLRQVQIKKRNKEEIFRKNREQGARQEGVYPAEKLRF